MYAVPMGYGSRINSPELTDHNPSPGDIVTGRGSLPAQNIVLDKPGWCFYFAGIHGEHVI